MVADTTATLPSFPCSLKSTNDYYSFLFINSPLSLCCNTNKFTPYSSHINYAVREKAVMVEKNEGENEEYSFLLNIHKRSILMLLGFVCSRVAQLFPPCKGVWFQEIDESVWVKGERCLCSEADIWEVSVASCG